MVAAYYLFSGRHDIAELLLKLVFITNHSIYLFLAIPSGITYIEAVSLNVSDVTLSTIVYDAIDL